MSLKLTCPHCRRRLAIKKPRPGTILHCPICTGVLDISTSESSDTPAPQDPKGNWWATHPDNPSPTPPDASQRLKELVNVRTLGAAAGATLLLIVGVVAGAAWVSKPKALPADLMGLAAARMELDQAGMEPRAAELAVEHETDLAGLIAPAAEALAVPEDVAVAAVTSVARTELPPAKPKPTVKRRDQSSDEDLRKQLFKVMEVSLDPPVPVKRTPLDAHSSPRSEQIQQMAKRPTIETHFTPKLLNSYSDLRGLPFAMGVDCQLGKEPAENMQSISREMRTILAQSRPNEVADRRFNAELIRQRIGSIYTKIEPNREAAITCLMQMLQPENTPVRQILVEQLAQINRPKSSEALARIAMFDLSDTVRTEAINALFERTQIVKEDVLPGGLRDQALTALGERRREDIRQVLLAGLRHPFPPVADHAAEALVALGDTGAIPALKKLADEPDPSAPYYDQDTKQWLIPELVRINHLSNCAMCHAPSKSQTDLVRGRIPSPNQPLPPMTQYYEDTNGIFVRADVTYLRQDFSMYQPVDHAGQWPSMQRYDYLVRKRPAETYSELVGMQQKRQASTYPQREAVLFALKELGQ
jgi:HEAT repeat protein